MRRYAAEHYPQSQTRPEVEIELLLIVCMRRPTRRDVALRISTSS
jgi:hypothetical protein